MYSDYQPKNSIKRFAFPALMAFWGVVALVGFSNSISDMILEAVTAIGIYG